MYILLLLLFDELRLLVLSFLYKFKTILLFFKKIQGTSTFDPYFTRRTPRLALLFKITIRFCKTESIKNISALPSHQKNNTFSFYYNNICKLERKWLIAVYSEKCIDGKRNTFFVNLILYF